MPLPNNPSKCIPRMKNEGRHPDQAVAMCLQKQRDGKTRPPSRTPLATDSGAKDVIRKARLISAQADFANTAQKKSIHLMAQIDDVFEIPPGDESKYVCYYLIRGDKVNENDWGVAGDSIEKNIQTAEGMPFVVTSSDFVKNSPYRDKYMHPNIMHFKRWKPKLVSKFDPENYHDVLEFQKPWKVGTIKKVLYDAEDDYWKALVEPDAQFRNMQFPPFCSIAVFQDDMSEPADKITKYHVTHLAGLMDKPAYGDEAVYEGSCFGPIGYCETQFVSPYSSALTEIKLSKSKIASMMSTDNPQVNAVPVRGIREKHQKTF